MQYGPAARSYLLDLVLDKQVVAVTQKKERYGRIVATLMLGTMDVNVAMVQAGMAWHYKQYLREQSEAQAVEYAQSEIVAG
jgi:endonuclease YncB( thermonuclease family)